MTSGNNSIDQIERQLAIILGIRLDRRRLTSLSSNKQEFVVYTNLV